MIPAILAVVTCAQATHLLWRYLAVDATGDPVGGAERRLRWLRSMGATWRPCLQSALTTAAGFASLATSEIPPVRDLGLFTAVGVLFFGLIPTPLLDAAKSAAETLV